jgi:hypothetical protein
MDEVLVTARLHSDTAAIGLSVIGLACAVWLLAKAAIELCRGLSCGDCTHSEAGEE